MYKDKKIILFIGALFITLAAIVFSVSFENNDDHILYFICSGALSGISSDQLIFSSVWWGKLLTILFKLYPSFNWYTLLLMIIQNISFLTIGYISLGVQKAVKTYHLLLLLFVLLGFMLICVLKIQFTTIALTAILSVLLCIQFLSVSTTGWCLLAGWSLLAFSIRLEAYLFLIIFSIPLIFSLWSEKKNIRPLITFLLICTIGWTSIYMQSHPSKTVVAFDQIAAKPVRFTATSLSGTGFTSADVLLMQSWYPGDPAFFNEGNMVKLADRIKSHKSTIEIASEWKKILREERYIIGLWLLSVLFCFLISPEKRIFSLVLNSLALALIFYLIAFSRFPHRVSYPIFMYLILVHLFYVFYQEKKLLSKSVISVFLFLIAVFKVYSFSDLFNLQRKYHAEFEQYHQYISANPDKVYITALGGLPVEYMSAWLAPEKIFPHDNIIFTGWYCYTQDYAALLKKHQLQNITKDVVNRNDIIFLLNNDGLETAFKEMMLTRYNIKCTFEEIENTEHLPLKRLVQVD
mgnify:FL=1